MKIYGDKQSGNCYKIQLLASFLKIDYEWIDIDILAKETYTADFLAKNPNGKIPLLELESGKCLSESNAILYFLADGSRLLPSDPYNRAKVLEWQFFEQYSHEPYIAVARFISKYLGIPANRKAEFTAKQAGGHKALHVMNQQLHKTPYLTGNSISIADISLYAYTHVAHEGGFDLSPYTAILSWITKIKSLDNYIDMQ